MKSFFFLLMTVAVLGCQERVAPSRSALADSGSQLNQTRARIGYDAQGRPANVQLEGVVVTGEAPFAFTTPPDALASMIIRTATASIEVDSLELAIDLTKQLATRVGGFVTNSTIEAGKNRLRSATLEVKLPAQRFEEALSGLYPIGKVETVNVNAEDVGEEFVDVTARMENARRLERRLIDLLATRTGKLKDVLDVEQALARVREEVERYDGRIRYLRAHTAMSTLSVSVHEPVPIVATAGRSVMGEAFRQSWRNFVALVSVAVQSLGVLIPLAVVAIVAWLIAKRWRRLVGQRAA